MDACVFLKKYPLEAVMITTPHVFGAPYRQPVPGKRRPTSIAAVFSYFVKSNRGHDHLCLLVFGQYHESFPMFCYASIASFSDALLYPDPGVCWQL